MAKATPNTTLDAFLTPTSTFAINQADELYVTSAEPANYAGITAVNLAGPFTPTFTGPADGSPNGRKITVDQLSDQSVTNTGTANHVVLARGGTDDVLVQVTTTPNTALTSGGTVTIAAYDISIADPT